jgi:hypothetical protein
VQRWSEQQIPQPGFEMTNKVLYRLENGPN